MVVGLVMALIGCYYVYRIIQAQQNRHMFRKLSVQGNEIEIFEESDDSYFDKYLNEVLYLESTAYPPNPPIPSACTYPASGCRFEAFLTSAVR